MKKKTVFLITLFFFFSCFLFFLLSSLYFRIEIPSESMLPTLKVKEQLLVQRYATFKRGDILVFYSKEEQQLLVKRLIGLAGDEIEIKEGTIYINQVYYPEPYLDKTDSYSGSFTVPDDSLFFLGDNRKNSEDSRFFINPYIAEHEVIGTVVFRIYPQMGKLS